MAKKSLRPLHAKLNSLLKAYWDEAGSLSKAATILGVSESTLSARGQNDNREAATLRKLAQCAVPSIRQAAQDILDDEGIVARPFRFTDAALVLAFQAPIYNRSYEKFRDKKIDCDYNIEHAELLLVRDIIFVAAKARYLELIFWHLTSKNKPLPEPKLFRVKVSNYRPSTPTADHAEEQPFWDHGTCFQFQRDKTSDAALIKAATKALKRTPTQNRNLSAHFHSLVDSPRSGKSLPFDIELTGLALSEAIANTIVLDRALSLLHDDLATDLELSTTPLGSLVVAIRSNISLVNDAMIAHWIPFLRAHSEEVGVLSSAMFDRVDYALRFINGTLRFSEQDRVPAQPSPDLNIRAQVPVPSQAQMEEYRRLLDQLIASIS